MSKKELYQVTFECEVLTPMFLGSADPRDAELRPPSIKGAMRFWWRAMNSHLSIEELRGKEGEIFGSSAGTGTKSAFQLTVDNPDRGITKTDLPVRRNIPAVFIRDGKEKHTELDSITFFAYGKDKTTSDKNEVAKFISVGTKFKVGLSSFSKEQILEAVLAFRVLSYFGALGGKSRNGFGSYRILSEESIVKEMESNEYKIKALELPKFDPDSLFEQFEIPDYPGFSKKAKYCEYKNIGNTWVDAVSKAALKYAMAKKEMKKNPGFPESDTFPNKKELVGGLGKKKGKVKLVDAPERIPKPFYIKFSKDENGAYFSRILYLPSKFLEGQKSDNNIQKLIILQKEFLAYTEKMYNDICQEDVEVIK